MVHRVWFSFQNCWWVFLFIFASLFSYSHCTQEKKAIIKTLRGRIQEMSLRKQQAEALKEDLLLAVASQEDPAWIEMVLMRDLGVVPEGWLKVHFNKEQ